MKKRIRSYTAGILCLFLLLSTIISVSAEGVYDKEKIENVINSTAKYELSANQNLKFGTNGGEWTAMSLLRGTYKDYSYIYDINKDYFENYINDIENEFIQNDGELDSRKYTEYSRTLIALAALGYDAHNVCGYDVPLRMSFSMSKITFQGINGPVYALIGMNAGGYKFYTREEMGSEKISNKLSQMDVELEDEGEYSGAVTEGKLLKYIMDNKLSTGGWAFSAMWGMDVDITAMTLEALAPYYLDEEKFNNASLNAYPTSDYSFSYTYTDLREAVQEAVKVLSEIQKDNGGYESWGSINCESISQVITALSGLKIDVMSDEIKLDDINDSCSFIKSGATTNGVYSDNLIDSLLLFYDSEKCGFKHNFTGNVNAMATDQALYALIALDRFKSGVSSLYDMSDMKNEEYKNILAKHKIGDCNNDCEINSADLITLKKFLMINNDINAVKADVNKDGNVNIKDLICLKKVVA